VKLGAGDLNPHRDQQETGNKAMIIKDHTHHVLFGLDECWIHDDKCWMNPNLCMSCLDECQLSNQMLSARWSHDTARFVALVLTVRTVCLEDLTARSLLEVDRFGYIWII